ncbi:MAG: hypothetical protein O9296_11795, partial [Novosphingobium sp.]|nr:hypothetical protein [Novosphingobium sp.]
AMVRERKVAEDWLVSIDANRYSVPFALIGKTVQISREADRWVIRHAVFGLAPLRWLRCPSGLAWPGP